MKRASALLLAMWLGVGVMGAAHAKLPAPPPEDPKVAEAKKAKAEAEKKHEAAVTAKAQDRVAERYMKEKKMKEGGAAAVAQKK